MVGEWISLWRRLPDQYARIVLSRFFRYCWARHINPADVTDTITDEFRQALVAEMSFFFVKDPRVNHQNLCRVWNSMIGIVDGWSEAPVFGSRATQNTTYWRPTRFPPAFWQDVDAWLAVPGPRLSPEPEPRRPPLPLKPRTLRQDRYMRCAALPACSCCEDMMSGPSPRSPISNFLLKSVAGRAALSLGAQRQQTDAVRRRRGQPAGQGSKILGEGTGRLR